MSRFLLPILLFAMGFVFQACGDEVVVSNRATFSDAHPWTYQDSLVINFDISDTSQYYDLKLRLDFEDSYPYQNVYLKIGTKYPDGAWVYSQLNVDLAYSDGRWIADCTGHSCSAEINLIQNFYFRDLGSYAISVAQYTRSERLESVDAADLYLTALMR